jgi:CRP-like cAMP-binding protein
MFDNYDLSRIVLFDGLDTDEIKTLWSCIDAKVKKYKKNDIIIFEGEIIGSIGAVLSGSVQVLRTDIDGNRLVVASIQQYDLFAETYALSKNHESPVMVCATEDSVVLWLDVSRLLTTCSSACIFHRRLIQNIIELLANKNVYLNRKLDILSKRSLREKILQFLHSYSTSSKERIITIPYNRLAMADYLGVDRSALSRELSKMKADGLIDYHKNTFILRN